MPRDHADPPAGAPDETGAAALLTGVSSLPCHLVAHDAGGPPEWVHLIPAGTFSGRDGRGPYRLDAEAVTAAFARHGADLPIDYDHQSLSAEEKAGPVPAAGWITALEAREDGLWARVRWTERAAQMLAAREYRYLSPVFRHRADGTIVELLGAGLTHAPNLHLAAAAARADRAPTPAPESPRMSLPEAAAEALGVAPNADEGEIVAAARALRARADSPDPAQYVPMAQHRAVAEELARLQNEIAEREARSAVAEAMRAGKLVPALEAWAIDYAKRDLAGFRAFAAAAPAIVQAGVLAERPPASDLEAQIAEAEAEMARARQSGRPLRFADALAMVRRRTGDTR